MEKTIERDIYLNQLAQGVNDDAEGIEWFLSRAIDEQADILRALVYMALQAFAFPEDVPEAILGAELRPTLTPCVMMTKGSFRGQIQRIPSLPPEEYRSSFLLLLNMFRIADTRRRAISCRNGCEHWWHQDLADPEVLHQIRKCPA